MFTDPVEAGVVQQYRLLGAQLAAGANSLAQQNMLALERNFPHLALPQILQIAGPVFPEFPYLDQQTSTFERLSKTTLYIQCLEHMKSFNKLMVCEIKLEIMDQYGIPVARQRLVFEDEVLIDGRTLVSYNIHNGSEIWLMLVTTSVRAPLEEPDANDA